MIQVGSNDNIIQVLGSFLSDRLLKNCQIADTYSHPIAPHCFREGACKLAAWATIYPMMFTKLTCTVYYQALVSCKQYLYEKGKDKENVLYLGNN